MRLARALAASMVLVHAVGLAAAESTEEPPRRPRIGLALGGGGARGAAHIGVLKVLERLHVPIDYIAGTSVGAVIGGLYASGVPIEEIEKEMVDRNWSEILADRAPYRDLVWRRKEDEGRYLLDFELGLRRGKLLVPAGLRAGQKLGFELQALLLPVASINDFSKLPIPFRAVATDMETGERVVLDHGDLAQAALASMTVPGVFTPVEIDGRILVDGGLTSSLPVEVVRSMGADLVIAVDVGTPLVPRGEIRSFVGVTGQTFTFLTRLNSEHSAALADLVIRPDLAGISAAGFEEIALAISRGEAAAAAEQASLVDRFAIDEAGWSNRAAHAEPAPSLPSGTLTSVRVEGNQRVDERIILARARFHPGDPIQVASLRAGLSRVFGLDDFQSVRFGLVEEADGLGLVLHVREKPWGPTYLHFGIEAVDDLEGGATYGVKANLTRANLNSLGAEWRNDLQIGSRPGFRTELFQPLDYSGRLFVAPWAQLGRDRQPVYEEGRRIASYLVDTNSIELDGGIEYGHYGEIRLGVYRSRVHAEVNTGAADLPRFDIDGGGIAFRGAYDTRDRPAIPRHGTSIGIRAVFSRRELGATDPYDRVEGAISHFLGRGRHTAFGVLDGGTSLGSQLPAYDEFVVGGLFSLGGYSEGELRGQATAGVTVGYHYRLLSLPAGVGEGVYLGLLLDARNAWPSASDVSAADLQYGVTALVGADTLVGPIFFAYGRAEGGRSRFYLTVGRTL